MTRGQIFGGGRRARGVAAPLPQFSIGVHDGDSLTAFSYQSDPSRSSLPLTGKAPKIVANYGTPNDTVAMMLARQQDTIDFAVAHGAEFVMFRGGTNGMTEADYADWLDAANAAGLFVFAHQVPPKAGTDLSGYNTIIEALCASRPLTKYVQDCDVIAEAGYQPVSGATLDGIHFSSVGQYLIGAAGAPILAPYFDQTALVTSDTAAAQWVTNPLITGTGGSKSGGTGTVCDSCSVTSIGAGTSFVASIVAADGGDANQTPWQRIELAASGGGGHSIEARWTMVHPAIDADYLTHRTIDCMAEVRFVGIDSSDITGIEFGPDLNRTYMQVAPRMLLRNNGTLDQTMVMRTAYTRGGPSAYSANALKVMLNVLFADAFASAAGYIDIRCVSALGGL